MAKFRVDEWVLYCAFPDSELKYLCSERQKAVVLCELPEDPFYDYRIIIEASGKIKKVREHQLFPGRPPTY
jgi:hypothetical protein